MEKINRVIIKWMKGDLNHKIDGDDPRPEQLIEESHKDVIIADPILWDGAGIEQVRRHFAQYLREIDQDKYCEDCRFGVCLVIDERSLKSIALSDNPEGGFVGVVDGRYDPEVDYDEPSYRGYMRSLIWALWPLYVNLDLFHMPDLCPNVPARLISVYDEGTGIAQDEEGNEIPKDLSRRLPPELKRGRGQS